MKNTDGRGIVAREWGACKGFWEFQIADFLPPRRDQIETKGADYLQFEIGNLKFEIFCHWRKSI
ncbi:MAG TPA: hypothetical protein VG733_03205 [Chthoniobacteraceae bacterium]|nr:hypothetical protein [Chthoniobacteraceae bacterium]